MPQPLRGVSEIRNVSERVGTCRTRSLIGVVDLSHPHRGVIIRHVSFCHGRKLGNVSENPRLTHPPFPWRNPRAFTPVG